MVVTLPPVFSKEILYQEIQWVTLRKMRQNYFNRRSPIIIRRIEVAPAHAIDTLYALTVIGERKRSRRRLLTRFGADEFFRVHRLFGDFIAQFLVGVF